MNPFPVKYFSDFRAKSLKLNLYKHFSDFDRYFPTGLLFQGVRQLSILKFTNDEKRDFLQKWYRIERWQNRWEILLKDSLNKPGQPPLSEEQAKAQSDAEAEQSATNLYRQIVGNFAINNQLAVNPLLLTIIAATHNAFDALPERRVNLYKKMFSLLLEDRPNRRDTRLTLKEAAENQGILQNLAMNLTKQNKVQFSKRQGSQCIQAMLVKQCDQSSFRGYLETPRCRVRPTDVA